MLDFAQRFTAQVDFSSVERARAMLTEAHAFMDPAEALDRGVRLELPAATTR
ncbi:MAG: hypothetical protein ACKVPX_04050 [Myxococcaceae bacterium]